MRISRGGFKKNKPPFLTLNLQREICNGETDDE